MNPFRSSALILKSFIFFLLIAWSASAEPISYAQFMQGFQSLGKATPAFQVHTYVIPNELNPELAKPAYARIPKGAYLTVGTERALISAALSPKVTHVLVADRDPLVKFYNDMNVFLFKASFKDGKSVRERREHHLRLRLAADESEWLRAGVSGYDEEKIREFYAFTAKSLRGDWSNRNDLKAFYAPPVDAELSAFREANYLYDDALFARVENLAIHDRILSVVLDWSDLGGMDLLARLLKDAEIPLAAVDVSNAWYEQYMGPERFNEVLGKLESHGRLSDESVILLLDHHNRQRTYRGSVPTPQPHFANSYQLRDFHNSYQWAYHAYTRGFLRAHSKSGATEIPKKITDRVSTFDGVVTDHRIASKSSWCRLLLFAENAMKSLIPPSIEVAR